MKMELKNVKIHVTIILLMNEEGGHKKCVKYCGKETVNGYKFIFFYKDTNNNKICVESCNLNTLEKQFSLSQTKYLAKNID